MKCHQFLLWGVLGLSLLLQTANAKSHEELTLLEDSEQNDIYIGRGKPNCVLPFGMYADPEDCGYFYICVAGRAKHQKCPADLHFDILRRTCLHKFIAICRKGDKEKEATTEKTTSKRPNTPIPDDDSFACPSFFGTFAHPSDCSKYYSCFMSKRFEKKCGGHELFDAVKKECRHEKEVHCGNRRRPPGYTTTSKPTKTTTKSKTETTPEIITERITTETEMDTTTERITETEIDTTTERITTKTETDTTTERITETEMDTKTERITTETEMDTTTERITTETETDTTTESTVDITTEVTTPNLPTAPDHNCDEDDVDCIITETGDVNDWFICPQDVGSYPHPSSDKLFIFCMNWIPSARKCGLDRFFSKELSTCVNID